MQTLHFLSRSRLRRSMARKIQRVHGGSSASKKVSNPAPSKQTARKGRTQPSKKYPPKLKVVDSYRTKLDEKMLQSHLLIERVSFSRLVKDILGDIRPGQKFKVDSEGLDGLQAAAEDFIVKQMERAALVKKIIEPKRSTLFDRDLRVAVQLA